jgi:hypothetical protein
MRVDNVAVNIRLSLMPGGLPHLCQGRRPSCCLLTKAGGLRGGYHWGKQTRQRPTKAMLMKSTALVSDMELTAGAACNRYPFQLNLSRLVTDPAYIIPEGAEV